MEDTISNIDYNIDVEVKTSNWSSSNQTSKWISEVESTLQIKYDDAYDGRSEILIMKLPDCLRIPLEQYTPQQWQFGLHNRNISHTSESEKLKMNLAIACGLGPIWDKFCDEVVDEPEAFMKLYGLDHVNNLNNKREVQHKLILDALTLILLTFCDGKLIFPTRLTTLLEPGAPYIFPWKDLFLFENQIPMFLLKKVFWKCHENLVEPIWKKSELEFLNRIWAIHAYQMCRYIFVTNESYVESLNIGKLKKCTHIFVGVYQILCGKNEGREYIDGNSIIQSATCLKKVGIQIKGVEGMLDEVAFHEGCLYLPVVKLYDRTESYFRNLVMYEFYDHFIAKRCALGEYVHLMGDLIKSLEDVRHLIDCDVIKNFLVTDKNAFRMWDNLQSGINYSGYSKPYHDMVKKINGQCKSTLHIVRTEFYQLFCSRPWYVIAIITASLIAIGTFIQAYASIIGSNRMKPHFPPN
jgi:hypothetical protein